MCGPCGHADRQKDWLVALYLRRGVEVEPSYDGTWIFDGRRMILSGRGYTLGLFPPPPLPLVGSGDFVFRGSSFSSRFLPFFCVK